MFDEEIYKKVFYGNNTQVVFRIGSMTGKRIFVGGRGFSFDFDKNNEKQMELISNILFAFYDCIENELITTKEKTMLADFRTVIEILNNYNFDR